MVDIANKFHTRKKFSGKLVFKFYEILYRPPWRILFMNIRNTSQLTDSSWRPELPLNFLCSDLHSATASVLRNNRTGRWTWNGRFKHLHAPAVVLIFPRTTRAGLKKCPFAQQATKKTRLETFIKDLLMDQSWQKLEWFWWLHFGSGRTLMAFW